MLLDLRTLSYNVENLEPDAALELLRDFWIAARERRSDFKHILIITGLPGSGKSALTRELVRLITGKEYLPSYYNATAMINYAEKERLLVFDNFRSGARMDKRTRQMIETAVNVASPDSAYISKNGKHIDTSNTYLIVNCVETPAWLDTSKMLHLHLHPWRMT